MNNALRKVGLINLEKSIDPEQPAHPLQPDMGRNFWPTFSILKGQWYFMQLMNPEI